MMHRRTGGSRWHGAAFAALPLACLLGTGEPLAQAANPLRGDLGVHDPVMIKAGNTYYIFATGNGVSVKTSTDRITWRNAGAAFAVNPPWHAQQVPGARRDLWAPDIHYRDGKYWLYYSVSTFGSRVSAIGLATASALSPAGGSTQWQDQGMVVSTSDASNHNAIDPNVVLDAEGVPWLAYGSWWTGIKMIRLDPATGKPAAGAQLLSLASHDGGIEGTFIIRHGGYYYHFVSWDRCCQKEASTYNIRVGRSARVTGPYADSKGVPMTAGGGDLIDRGDARWRGPGHNGIFVERDTVFLVNHAYDALDGGRSILWIRPLYWTSQGWPTLDRTQGSAVPVIRPLKPPAGTRGLGIRVDPRGRKVPAAGSRPALPTFFIPAR